MNGHTKECIPPRLLNKPVPVGWVVSDLADEICIPLVRSDAFVDEEHGIRVILLLDGPELVVVSTEERFLPVEFISRSLRACDKELSRRIVNRRGTLPR
jgi:hypothetical protein